MMAAFLRSIEALGIRSDERASLVGAFVLVFIAKIQVVLNLNYSVDDYTITLYGLGELSGSLIRQGRFGEYWLSEAFGFIGYDPARSPLLSTLICIGLSLWTANAALRLWQIEATSAVRALILVVIAAHPYTAEVLTYRGIAVYHVVALALAFASMIVVRASVVGVLIAAVILSAALTIYQVPISYLAIFVIVDLAIRTIRSFKDESSPGPLSPIVLCRISVIVLGFVLYLVWLKISTWGMPPHPRSVLIGYADVPARMLASAGLLWQHFVSGTAYQRQLVPGTIMAIPLILVLVAVWEIGASAASARRAALVVGAMLIALFFAAAAMLGLPVLAKSFFLPPRVLSQIGLVWGGAAVIALVVSRRPVQRVIAGMLCVVAFSFIALNQQIFIDQTRVNTRDSHLTVRMHARLEAVEGFATVRSIAVNGSPREEVPVATAIREGVAFNRTAYLGWWSAASMISELTGRILKPANAAERAIAGDHCKNVARWPAPTSVAVRDHLAIVCL